MYLGLGQAQKQVGAIFGVPYQNQGSHRLLRVVIGIFSAGSGPHLTAGLHEWKKKKNGYFIGRTA